MFIYQEEPFFRAWPEMQGLLQAHWSEIAQEQDLLKLNPDLDMYRKADAAGALHLLTVRHNHRLVGYYVAFVKRHLHYKDVLISVDDVYFLHPLLRQGRVGIRLFIEAERMCRQHKAQLNVVKEKLAHPHEAIFRRLGYEPIERVWWRRLDKETT
jgi:GNAT superfamily N-acetyltransferase